jgi:hypothetical protein
MMDAKKFGTCDQQYLLLWGKPSPLMEALVNDAGAKDLLDFYRLVEMSPEDVDSLEVTTIEGQVPLAGGYRAFIRNFPGMYYVCEKQINWSDDMLLALRWEDYHAYMTVKMASSVCYSGNLSLTISIDPSPPWVPPRNLASQLPPTPSQVESIVESSKDEDVDIGEDVISAKDIKDVPSI